MSVVYELETLKKQIKNDQPGFQTVDKLKHELPVHYRTHILSTWNRYLMTRNQHVVLRAIETVINELKRDPREDEHPTAPT